MTSRIPRWPGGWYASSRDRAFRLAGDDRIPRVYRLLFLAEARANTIGHAEFAPGELARELGRRDRLTGERRPALKQKVQQAIAEAKRLGLVHSLSSSRCIVLPSHDYANGLASAGATCRAHGIGEVPRRKHRRTWPARLRVVAPRE